MAEENKSNFKLKGQKLIVVPGSNKAFSNANLTDEAAIAYLKKNPNRKVLFAKLPDNVDELLKEDVTPDPEKKLQDYTATELRTLYPDAKGRSKEDLISSIKSLSNPTGEDKKDDAKQDDPDSKKDSDTKIEDNQDKSTQKPTEKVDNPTGEDKKE